MRKNPKASLREILREQNELKALLDKVICIKTRDFIIIKTNKPKDCSKCLVNFFKNENSLN
jgi:hypothetical protein